MNWDKVEFTNHEAYLEIALEKLNFSQKTDADLHIRMGVTSLNYQGVPLLPKNAAYLIHRLQLINKSNIISVVFSALAAESFINYYALSKKKDKNYLRQFKSREGLSEAVVKWIDIPKEITGNFALTTGSAEVKNLQKLFTDRNKLAHHKASLQNVQDLDLNNIQDPNAITRQDVQSGYCATVNAIRLIQTVDPEIDISWLHNWRQLTTLAHEV
jgi:hypothetical protein